jgi:hypothetical protein
MGCCQSSTGQNPNKLKYAPSDQQPVVQYHFNKSDALISM